MTVEDSEGFYDLVETVRGLDTDLVSVTAVEPDLEDAFLRLTDRGTS